MSMAAILAYAVPALGIRHLTLYTFSSENWNRPKTEISALFSLLMEFLSREVPRMVEQGITMRVLGDLDSMPLAQRTALRHAIKRTEGGKDMVLNLALNYGGRGEIVRAMQNMLREGLRPEDVTEQALADHLYTAGQPDPDLLIRTSGEQRLSNYLLYQCAYSELYFTPVPWPDFDPAQLRTALDAACARRRVEVFYPPLSLCTDNGAMIALAGAMRLKQAHAAGSFSIKPRWDLSSLPPVNGAA